eukprot:1319882-Pyramimonas_sp.AAC.1
MRRPQEGCCGSGIEEGQGAPLLNWSAAGVRRRGASDRRCDSCGLSDHCCASSRSVDSTVFVSSPHPLPSPQVDRVEGHEPKTGEPVRPPLKL